MFIEQSTASEKNNSKKIAEFCKRYIKTEEQTVNKREFGYGVSSMQLYIPRNKSAIYEIKTEYGILDSILTTFRDSANDISYIIDELKKQRGQEFIEEVSYGKRTLNKIIECAGYILAFLTNEKSLEYKLQEYNYKNVDDLWKTAYLKFQYKIKNY